MLPSSNSEQNDSTTRIATALLGNTAITLASSHPASSTIVANPIPLLLEAKLRLWSNVKNLIDAPDTEEMTEWEHLNGLISFFKECILDIKRRTPDITASDPWSQLSQLVALCIKYCTPNTTGKDRQAERLQIQNSLIQFFPEFDSRDIMPFMLLAQILHSQAENIDGFKTLYSKLREITVTYVIGMISIHKSISSGNLTHDDSKKAVIDLQERFLKAANQISAVAAKLDDRIQETVTQYESKWTKPVHNHCTNFTPRSLGLNSYKEF